MVIVVAEKVEKSKDKPHDSKEAKSEGWKGGGPAKPAVSAGAPKGRPVVVPSGPILGANGQEIRGIVRISGKDLKGQWSIPRSLRSIRGLGLNLGQMLSGIVLRELKIPAKTMVGELDEAQIKKLEDILQHPEKYGAPTFMLNRQREFATNETHHLIAVDLGYAVKQDVEHEKDAYTWKGYRHAYGQKVRGQHTRSTGRSGMTVGVLRKAVIAKAGAAAATTGAGAQAAAQASDKGKAAGATGAPAAAAPKAEKAPAAKAAPAGKPAEKK